MDKSESKLAPCPFCAAGETIIHINKGVWTGKGWGEPVSVEVRHWCPAEDGQPSRMITRIGRDESSAIAAWNKRVAPTSAEQEREAELPPLPKGPYADYDADELQAYARAALAAPKQPALTDEQIDELIKECCHSDPVMASGEYCLTVDEVRAVLAASQGEKK